MTNSSTLAPLDNVVQGPDMREEIAKFIFTDKYARFLPELKRRETWTEAVGRVEDMHLRRFSHLDQSHLDEIRWAFDLVRAKRVVPSMRSLQFGGAAVEANNARLYNCATRHIDSVRAFSEVFFLLLAGCGVGMGLTRKFVHRMPRLVTPANKTGTVITYVVEDSAEGWADSIEALLNCYMVGNAYTGRRIVMDYSRIRTEGTLLKTSGGRAPGYLPLRMAHTKIKTLLDMLVEERFEDRLRTIDAYDILMHLCNAVLAGGIRRAASICLFDKDDELMMNAKVGNWYVDNPQRARSNNSVILVRSETTQQDILDILQKTQEWGEPGFVLVDDPDTCANPCQPAWATVLTPTGLSTMGELKAGDRIWSESGWTTVVRKWSTGVKNVHRYRTTSGVFYGTANHRLVSGGTKVEARDAESIDSLTGPLPEMDVLDPNDIMTGLLIGDGTVHGASGFLVGLEIGRNDQDYFSSEVGDLIGRGRPGIGPSFWEVKTHLDHTDLPVLPVREVPGEVMKGGSQKILGFLRGLFSANGSVVNNRVTLKSSSKVLVEQVQVLLSAVGIRSYLTTNKAHSVQFANGEYGCKESYDINIGHLEGRQKFATHVGFLQQYKTAKLQGILQGFKGIAKTTFDIRSADYVSTEEVFDITVDNATHTYWTGGVNVSNCAEIHMMPVTDDGRCGVQFCNLSSINGAKVSSAQDFYECARAASIIGTLQATYTDFPYLGHAAEEITRQEALLGVSMTAMMENAEVLLTPDCQQTGASIVVETNARWAAILGINPAARCTAIKPEGTGSLALGTMASGIHPAHSHVMFRRIRANKLDPVYQFFKMYNPHMCEEDPVSPNHVDDVITFPVINPVHTMVKKDLDALEHLGIVRSTQKHWVLPGTSEHNTRPLSHSVSSTVIVREHEWDEVGRYLFDNLQYFSSVSFIAASGDKDYAQAPMEAVTTVEDVERFNFYLNNYIPMDYTVLQESEDGTSLQMEMACSGPQGCEL